MNRRKRRRQREVARKAEDKTQGGIVANKGPSNLVHITSQIQQRKYDNNSQRELEGLLQWQGEMEGGEGAKAREVGKCDAPRGFDSALSQGEYFVLYRYEATL